MTPAQRAWEILAARRPKLAERDAREGLVKNPSDAELHAVLALALNAQGLSSQAIEEARRAIGISPDLAYAHYVLAFILYGEQRLTESIAALDSAIGFAPQEAAYQALRADILLRQDNYRSAQSAAEAALLLDPQNVLALRVKTEVLLHRKKFVEADASAKSVLALRPSDPEVLALGGSVALARGRAKDATAAFRSALALDPRSPAARAGLVSAQKASNPLFIAVRGVVGFIAIAAAAPSIAAGEKGPAEAFFLLTGGAAIIVYATFVMATLDSLVTMYLLAHNFGRSAVGSEDRAAAIVSICLFLGNMLCFGIWLGTPENGWLFGGVVCGLAAFLELGAARLRRSPWRVAAVLWAVVGFPIGVPLLVFGFAQQTNANWSSLGMSMGALVFASGLAVVSSLLVHYARRGL